MFDQGVYQQEKEGFPGSHFTHAASEYPSQSIARQLMILIDGGITNAQHMKSREPLDLARTLAKQLLGEPAADYSI